MLIFGDGPAKQLLEGYGVNLWGGKNNNWEPLQAGHGQKANGQMHIQNITLSQTVSQIVQPGSLPLIFAHALQMCCRMLG
jgi:hypothetical protein